MKSNIFTTALLACLASSTAATPLDPRATPKPNLVEVVVTEVTTTYAIHIKHYYKYNGIYSWDDNWSLTVTNAPTSINLHTSATSTSLSTTTILTIYDGGKGKTKTSTTTQIAGATTSSIEAVDSTSSVVSTTPSKSATSSSVISKSTSSTASSSSKSSTTSSIKTSSTSTKSATTSSSIHASSSTIPSSTSVKSSTTLSKVVSSSTSKSSSTTLSKSSSSTTSAKPTTTTSSISQTQPNCGIYATDISEAGWQQSAGNYAGSNASDCYFFCLRDRNYCTSVAYAGPGVMPEGQECIILQYKANSPNLLGVTTTPTSASAFTIYDADCAPPPAATPVVKSAAVCNATWDVWGGPSWNLPDSSTIETRTLGTPAECKAECARLEGYCASWAWFPASYSQCTILNVAIETPGAYGDMNPSDPQSDVGYASDAGCP